MTWVLVYVGSSSLCLARHDWEFSIGSLSLTNLGILELLIQSLKVRGGWLMREMQSRAVMESTAVLLRVLITCYAGLALAQGKVLGTKPRGVFAPAIRLPSPLSRNQGEFLHLLSCACLSWAGGRVWLLWLLRGWAGWAVQRSLCSHSAFALLGLLLLLWPRGCDWGSWVQLVGEGPFSWTKGLLYWVSRKDVACLCIPVRGVKSLVGVTVAAGRCFARARSLLGMFLCLGKV